MPWTAPRCGQPRLISLYGRAGRLSGLVSTWAGTARGREGCLAGARKDVRREEYTAAAEPELLGRGRALRLTLLGVDLEDGGAEVHLAEV
eukprot:scaffold53451_cov57-Phaeocystis_antarctica.AAC.2